MFGSNTMKTSIMKALSLVTFLCMIKIGDGQHLGVLGPERDDLINIGDGQLGSPERDDFDKLRDDLQNFSGVAGLDPKPDPGSFTPAPLDLERNLDGVAGLAPERNAGPVRNSPAKARAHFDEIYDPYLGTNRVERDPRVYVEGRKTVTRVLQSNGMSFSPTISPSRSPTKGKSPTRSPTKGKSPTCSPTKGKSPTKSPTRSPTKGKGKSPTRSPTKGNSPTKSPTRSPTKGKEGFVQVLRIIDGKTVKVWRKINRIKSPTRSPTKGQQ